MEYDPVFLGYETLDGTIKGTRCCYDTDIKTLGVVLLNNWCTQPRVESLVTEVWIDVLDQDINNGTFCNKKRMQDMGYLCKSLHYDSRKLIPDFLMTRMYLWDTANQEWLVKVYPDLEWRSLMQMVLEL